MFSFYGKKRLTADDQKLCEEIDALANSDPQVKEYLDELVSVQKVSKTGDLRMLKRELEEQKEFINRTTTTQVPKDQNISTEKKPETETPVQPVKQGTNEQVIMNPLSELVIEREHNVQDAFQKHSMPPVSESVGGQNTEGEPVFKDFGDPFDKPLPQAPVNGAANAGEGNNQQQQQNPGEGQTTGNDQQNQNQGNNTQSGDAGAGAQTGNASMQDMDPAAKKRAFEQTADAIMSAYGQYIPPIFAGYAKIDDYNFDKLVYEGKIDPRMNIGNGTTVSQWKTAANEQADQIFAMSKEQHDSIREPLVEVLMENNFSLTPMQRLLIAVGMHVGSMGYAAYKISKENKMILETLSRKYKTEKSHFDSTQEFSNTQQQSATENVKVHPAQQDVVSPDIDEFRGDVNEQNPQPEQKKPVPPTARRSKPEKPDDKLNPEEEQMAEQVIAGMNKKKKK